MRIIFLLFLFLLTLYAKSTDSCYTVQLQSALYSPSSLNQLEKKRFPTECTLMRISNTLTVRCGCFNHIKEATKRLPKYKSKYKYAYIATSYKYRFNKKAINKANLKQPSHSAYSSNEELKLMLQAFLYSNDLPHAYQTAKLGYKKHPNSYYWNQKMAEVCRWSGKATESIKYMKFMYHTKHNPKVANNIINLALQDYQYESIKNLTREEVKRNPSKKNIDRMVYIYSQIGEPEAAAQFLENLYTKDKQHPQYLDKALQIYMNMSDLDAAGKIISIIETNKLYTLNNVKLISYYYYSKRSVSKSFEVLEEIKNPKKYDEQYLKLKSDLGWYLEKFAPAADASLELIKHKEGRLVDYERVIAFNRTKNKTLAGKMALKAYNKFHLSYLFYLFANKLIQENDMKTLQTEILRIDKQANSQLLNDPNYWFIKAKLYHYEKKNFLAKNAIKQAVLRKPNSLQVKFTAINLYQEYGMFNALRQELIKLNTDTTLPHEFYFPMASFSFAINDINLANYYVQKLIQEKNQIINTTEFKFLQADIYNIRNNHNAYLTMLHTIVAQLDKDAVLDPEIKKDDMYLYNLLRAKMSLLTSDDFIQKLKQAKPYLTQAHYDDLAYSLALKNGSLEKAHSIYLRTKNRAIWLRFSDALNQQNHTKIENLLSAYLYSISSGDASYAAELDGQIALAQSMSYKTLAHNDDNQNAYISLLGLVKKRADLTSIKSAYYLRDPLLRKYIAIKNSNYINDSYYLLSNLNYYRNSDLDKNLLREVPDDTLELNLGLKKLFDKGMLTFIAGYANSMDSYFVYSLFGKYQLTKELNVGGGYYKNVKTDESTQLLLGGKKDKIELKANYAILNSTDLDILYEYNRYNSQDDVYLGNGEYVRVNLGHQIRNGYPDMRLSLFSDGAIYNETSGKKGVIDKLQAPRSQVLPNNFMNLGVDFAYGMQNSDIYTRVWRPYFEVSSYYNTDIAAFSYGFNAGYGGKVYSQDHLVIGTSYTNSVNGIGGSIFGLFLNYKFLYAPR